MQACELAIVGDPRIGKVPNARKARVPKRKPAASASNRNCRAARYPPAFLVFDGA